MSGDLGEIYLRIDGDWPSANHYKTAVPYIVYEKGKPRARNRYVITPEARQYAARVKSIATGAALQYRWQIPEYCAVRLLFWNGRIDFDNSPKVLMDAMQGILYGQDSRVKDARTVLLKSQENSPYVEVYIRAIDPAHYGQGKVSARLRGSNVSAAIARLGL